MRIAITGGNGDMGRALLPALLAAGHTAVSIDRTLPSGQDHQPQVRRLVADVTDYGAVVGALTGCDAVVHLAAHRSPINAPDYQVYVENTSASYHVLAAAAALGINRVCLASSINAIGGVFSRTPRYDYLPLDEQHPTYAEDPYSLSKWVLEQQADAFARRHPAMRIASLRFHWLIASGAAARERMPQRGGSEVLDLWGYTALPEAARACLLALTADFSGHQAFYIVAPLTASATPTAELLRQHYPDVPLRAELPATSGLFDCANAARLLGWEHATDA